jgi:hypothetical protein
MKTMINNIKALFAVDKQETICNYTNNYYGDQYCKTKL